MLVTVSRDQFQTAVSRLQGPLSDKNVSHIGVKTEGNNLILTASDKILTVTCSIDAQIEKEGIVFLPAKLLTDVSRELPPGQVQLKSIETGFMINAGEMSHFTMKLPQIKNVNWPTFERPNNLLTALVPSDRFQYMIEQVQFTIATDSPHPYGAVGYVHRPEPNSIRLVGTDGFRLSYCEISLETMPADFLKNGLCLSKRALTELQKICTEGFETISLSIGDDQKTLIAEVPGYFVHLRLVNVNYPNYQGVIPSKHPQSIKLPRAGIQSMARRVLLAADKSRSLHLKFETDKLTLSSHTVGESEGQETLGLDDYKGPHCGISLNGRYLNDIISTTSSQQLLFGFKNEDQPVVIAPAAEPSECRSTHVLVPMRETH